MPNLKVFFCTSGVYNNEREIAASFKILNKTCENADIFNDIEVFNGEEGVNETLEFNI